MKSFKSILLSLTLCLFTLLGVSCARESHPASPILGTWVVDIARTVQNLPQDASPRADFLRVDIQIQEFNGELVFATMLDGVQQKRAKVNLVSQQNNRFILEVIHEIEYNPNRKPGTTTGVRTTLTLLDGNSLKMDSPVGAVYYTRKK